MVELVWRIRLISPVPALVVSYETIILHAIHQFKYGNNISVGALLASFMADFSFPDINFAGLFFNCTCNPCT